MMRMGVMLGAWVAACVSVCVADPATIVLRSGDVLTGEFISNDGVTVVLEHGVLGTLSIPVEQVSQLQVTPATGEDPIVEISEPLDDEEAAEAAEEAIDDAIEETDKGPWAFRFEVGLDGSEGNTERFAGRFGFYADRETERSLFHFQSTYYRASQDGDKTADRFNTQIRNDWKLGESRWDIFARAEADVDEFKEYDLRLSGAAGIGYRFIDNPDTKLVGRIGPGLAYEFGVEDEEVIPELFTGLELNHKLNERNFINAYINYIPDLSDTDNYLVHAGADWEYIMTDDGAVSLKIGFADRYDNQVDEGIEKNDVDYYATLNWRF